MKRIIIKGIFNDALTGYEDKESSVTILLNEEDLCDCGDCGTCRLIERYGLTDYDDQPN